MREAPIYAALVEEYGDPEQMEPVLTVEELLARREASS